MLESIQSSRDKLLLDSRVMHLNRETVDRLNRNSHRRKTAQWLRM